MFLIYKSNAVAAKIPSLSSLSPIAVSVFKFSCFFKIYSESLFSKYSFPIIFTYPEKLRESSASDTKLKKLSQIKSSFAPILASSLKTTKNSPAEILLIANSPVEISQ